MLASVDVDGLEPSLLAPAPGGAGGDADLFNPSREANDKVAEQARIVPQQCLFLLVSRCRASIVGTKGMRTHRGFHVLRLPPLILDTRPTGGQHTHYEPFPVQVPGLPRHVKKPIPPRRLAGSLNRSQS